jgi:hypothetical protein
MAYNENFITVSKIISIINFLMLHTSIMYLGSFNSNAIYGWWSVNIPSTHSLCLSSLGEKFHNPEYTVCIIYLGALKVRGLEVR